MGRPFLWPEVGFSKQEPVPEVLGSAFARSVGPALSFCLSLGATKVALALLSSLRCDQLSLGTTELQGCFNERLLVGERYYGAGSEEHAGPGADLPVSQRRLASIVASAGLATLVAGLVWQHECGPGRRTMQ
jgi:hypothetical protein